MTTEYEEFFNKRVEEKVAEQLKSHKDSVETEISIFKFISSEVDNARLLYEDFKYQELSFGMVEAEGGYRSLLTIKNQLWSYYLTDVARIRLEEMGYNHDY